MGQITDILKDAIQNSGLSNKKLGILSGVNRNSIARFLRGSTGLSLEQAEMLVEFFGIKLTKKEK
jgi:predicted transcriptional regulator